MLTKVLAETRRVDASAATVIEQTERVPKGLAACDPVDVIEVAVNVP